MPEGLLCQEWMPPWLCVVIVISVVVVPQVLNMLGAGKVKPIKAVAEKIKENGSNGGKDVADTKELLSTISLRTNTTYRELKSLSERYKRTQDDIEQIRRDIITILNFIED